MSVDVVEAGRTQWSLTRASNIKPVRRYKTRPDVVETERLYDAKEVLVLLGGISARTLWGLTNAGKIKCVRIGRLIRYAASDVNRFIESSRSS